MGHGRLGAVLFDMDGTLVDSEKVWQRALEELAVTLGGDLPSAVRESMVGTTTPQAIRLLYEAIGKPSQQNRRDPGATTEGGHEPS